MAEPPITLRALHDSGARNLPISRVVVHATNGGAGYPAASADGMAMSTARYFAGEDAVKPQGSAHYVCDVAREVHCVPDDVTAWHAPPDAHSVGVEICADGGQGAGYTRDQWLSGSVWPAVVRAAGRTAELCARFHIPVARIGPVALKGGQGGICGHWDVTAAWDESDHTDPGDAFPWAEFMGAVTGQPVTVVTPVAPGGSTPTQLRQGATGPAVTALQARLNRLFPAYSHLAVDGRFGPGTAAVIQQFQTRSHLVAEGVVGPLTWAALLAAGY